MAETPSSARPRLTGRIMDRLNTPDGTGPAPATPQVNAPEAAGADSDATRQPRRPRKAKRAAETRENTFRQRVRAAEAEGDLNSLLSVYTDRIRSLGNETLTRSAIAALARLVAASTESSK